ncbi:MAG: Gfo/Idh/MocA family oxidoreductase, partial [Armatimonadota bacterium]
RGREILSLLRNISYIDVRAICDVRSYSLSEALKILPNVETADNVEDIIKRDDIDAMIIATPLNTHYSLINECINHNKHVYSESIMAFKINEASSLLQKVTQIKSKIQIGHQRRYNPLTLLTESLVDKDIIGKVISVYAQHNENINWKTETDDENEDPQINWKLYRDTSLGLVSEYASHQIDIINRILNMTPSWVSGIGRLDYYKDSRDIYDNIYLIFDYPNGIKLQYKSIQFNDFGERYEQFIGEKGNILLSIQYMSISCNDADSKSNIINSEAEKLGLSVSTDSNASFIVRNPKEQDDLYNAINSFAMSIMKNENNTNLRDSYNTTICCIKAQEAMDVGKKIRVI